MDIKNLTVPMVTEDTPKGERTWDLFSRLLKDRIVTLNGEVNGTTAAVITAQLLYLDSVGHEPIELYINSPGGVVTDGLAIVDTMNLIKSPVHTISMGMAASMGAFILSQGEKGQRHSTPSATIMIHQPLGGFSGQATDIQIHAERILKIKELLTKRLADSTNGKTSFEIMEDLCDRDNFLDPEQALEIGIIDNIL